VFPPPDRAWLTANRTAYEQFPERTRTVLEKIQFTLADATSMDFAVNVDGRDPLEAARCWMDEHLDQVQVWFR
jgi:glycine betaine/proline transport system substrate-binding protein